MIKVLLGVTGSVAAKLTPKLVNTLLSKDCQIQIIFTDKSLYFWKTADLPAILCHRTRHEWEGFEYKEGSKILHIELRNWADLFLIAPLSANTLAKLANGLADNLLTSATRAWDRKKPLIIAPAMNTQMWEHPATEEHLEKLNRWYPQLKIILPVEKKLACGDMGVGAMAPIEGITEEVARVHACCGL